MDTMKSRANMAASLVSDARKTERTLAIPAGLTFAEVERYVQPYLAADERLAGIVEYSF